MEVDPDPPSPKAEKTRRRVSDAQRCFVLDCSSTGWHLKKWLSGTCTTHHVEKTECDCPLPYTFYSFPSKLIKPEEYEKWLRRINRKQRDGNALLEPSNCEKVCSKHFVDARPTVANPWPSLSLGYDKLNPELTAMYLFDPDLDPRSFLSKTRGEENELIEAGASSIQQDQSYVSNMDTEIKTEPTDTDVVIETKDPKETNSLRQEWSGKKIVKSVVISPQKLKLGGSSVIIMNVSEAVKCKFCEEKFASDELRRSHVLASHKDQTAKNSVLFNCSQCDGGFPSIASLALHLKEYHGDMNERRDEMRKLSNKCIHCGKKFFIRRQLERHLKDEHHKKPEFKCEYCDEDFPSENLRMSHMMTFHQKQMDGGLFKCCQCEEEFSLKADLTLHEREYHPEFECKYCEQKFPTERSRMSHMFSCHRQLMIGDLYKCPLCTKGFPYEADLDRHLREKHKTAILVVCKYCEATFPSENLLLCHMSASHVKELAETTHKCHECDQRFPNRTALAEHMRAGHPTTTTITIFKNTKDCKFCDKTFPSETLLLCHMFDAHKDEAYKTFHKCSQCDRGFRNKTALARHLRQDHGMTLTECRYESKILSKNVEPKIHRYACMQCDMTFPTVKMMKTHEEELDHKRKPDEKKTSHLCDQCGKLCKSLMSFRAHSLIHTGEKNHVCKTCGERFMYATDWWRHCRSKHNLEGPKKVHCDVCGRGFLKPAWLRVHQRTHTGEKPFSCETCGKSFVTDRRRDLHVRFAHKLQRPLGSKQAKEKVSKTFPKDIVPQKTKLAFECPDCGCDFACRSELNTHMVIHTSLENLFQFQCQQCYEEFADEASLTVHMRGHARIDGQSSEPKTKRFRPSSEPEERLYECPVPTCRKSFAYLKDLTVHQVSHTDDKPLECSLCRERFRSEEKLRKHVSRHDGRMVECNICLMKFNGRAFLKKHLKKHDAGVLCDICGREFALRENLIAHRETHDVDDGKEMMDDESESYAVTDEDYDQTVNPF